MVKNRLIVEYEYNFDLYGIISVARDYKLAWLINQALDLHLVKVKDVEISFISKQKLVISNYLYETEHTQLRLLKNKSEVKESDKMNYLIPELNRFDYFIMKTGALGDYSDSDLINRIQNIKEIQYIVNLDIEMLKSKENLIF
jgi:hypothetical protein